MINNNNLPILFIYILWFIIGIITLCIYYGRRKYGFLNNCGFPIIKPSLFLGSVPNAHKIIHHLEDVNRLYKYGSIWGIYQGDTAEVHVADPEIIRLILVKDFEYFPHRSEGGFGNPTIDDMLDFLQGNKCKKVRGSLTPQFTTSRLKELSEVMNKTALEYSNQLKDECSANGKLQFNTRIRLAAYFIDMLNQCILGIQLGNSSDPNNEFAVGFRDLMGEKSNPNFLSTLSNTFPFLSNFVETDGFDDSPIKLIESTFQFLIKTRIEQNRIGVDMFKALHDIWNKTENNIEFHNLGITKKSIIAQLINFYIGGFDGATTPLCHLLYYLAQDEQSQNNLRNEIDNIIYKDNNTNNINYDIIHEDNMPYLSACINEAFRLCPPLIRLERICKKDWFYSGIHIKKNTLVIIPLWALHRNSKLYEQPDIFNPQRFMPENKESIETYNFATFGHGPRNCIGMRFGIISAKMLCIHLIRNFYIRKRPDTILDYKCGASLFVCLKPLYVDLVPRTF